MLQWKPRLLTALAIVALATAALVGSNLELFGWWW